MKIQAIVFALLSMPLACSSTQTPEPEVPAPPPAEPATATAPPPAPAPAEPTAEEKKAQEQARQLEQDFVKQRAEAKIEAERWNGELRKQAKALAERKYPTLRAGLEAALKSPHRKPGAAERDQYRHPVQTLEFFGVKPTSTVLEYGPGEGWYTELLAPVLAQRGKLIVTMTDPNGPETERATLYAQRVQLLLDKSPELFGKVERAVFDPKNPTLELDGSVDVVLMIRSLHGLVRDGKHGVWLANVHKALKPGGVLGVVQHRAKPDADPKETAKQGYLPEAWLIQEIESAGFKLAAKSEVNANPKDTKDYETGVWALPPTYRLGDKDREKYTQIGESDRMTLRFVKSNKP